MDRGNPETWGGWIRFTLAQMLKAGWKKCRAVWRRKILPQVLSHPVLRLPTTRKMFVTMRGRSLRALSKIKFRKHKEDIRDHKRFSFAIQHRAWREDLQSSNIIPTSKLSSRLITNGEMFLPFFLFFKILSSFL